MTKPKLKSGMALIFGMSIAVVASNGPVGRTVEVDGHVYSARGSSGAPISPIVGAVISTSLESTTAFTDQTGRFHLRTHARVAGDEFYIITVRSGALVCHQRTMSADMGRQQFVLSEPPPR